MIMLIELNHIACDSSGKLHVKKTLCNIINEKLNMPQLSATRIDFLGQHETLGNLAFRIQIKHQGNLSLLNHFYTAFNLTENDIISLHSEDNQSIQLLFKNPEQIIIFFKDLGYETLLNNEQFCLAHQIDLLQTLISETINELIIKSNVSIHLPELIEFDPSGHLSAIVIASSSSRYKLENIEEINSFFTNYCKFQLPDSFIKLIRSQTAINAWRQVQYLKSVNNDGLPLYCSQNKIKDAQINITKKQLSASLERRDDYSEPLNNQERQMFLEYLISSLGNRFEIKWRLIEQDYRLIIASAMPTLEFNTQDIALLKTVLQNTKLLTEEQIIQIEFSKLLGARAPLAYSIPEQVEEILSCHITYDIPNGTPSITPHGGNYDATAIHQEIELRHRDPQTKEPLEVEQLRQNKLLERLIEFYKSPINATLDLNITAPALLKDPETNEFYCNPVVTLSGETIEESILLTDSDDYPNRALTRLIQYYNSTLTKRSSPIIRSQVRATIAANLGLLCPGDGALTEADAQNESEYCLPHVEYNALTSSLNIFFTSTDYARRLEIELLRWQGSHYSILANSSNLAFTADNTEKVDGIFSKNTLKSDGTTVQRQFKSRLSIQTEALILVLFESFCSLKPEYFERLKTLDSMGQMDDLNELVNEITLPTSLFSANNTFHRAQVAQRETSILSIRATSDQQRMQPETYNDSSAAIPAPIAPVEDHRDIDTTISQLRIIRLATQTQQEQASFNNSLDDDEEDDIFALLSSSRSNQTRNVRQRLNNGAANNNPVLTNSSPLGMSAVGWQSLFPPESLERYPINIDAMIARQEDGAEEEDEEQQRSLTRQG